ncbi:hypothetical protein GC176_21555 [bacterium]|nr:hypothetical protein [bacterium]
MKRWLAVATIVTYLGVLFFGVASHALGFRQASHPGMYFIVWDMFCGWSGYENRLHIIGQGESGRFYQIAPAPWGEIKPFGDLDRHHYDPFANHSGTIALNTLRHTHHEPMRKIMVVEECWAKKFNLPDSLWAQRYGEKKQPYSYFYLRKEYAPDGEVLTQNASWFDYQDHLCLSDNPRLWQDSQKGRSAYQLPTIATASHETQSATLLPANGAAWMGTR